MKNKLREELDKLATNTLRYNGEHIQGLYEQAKNLFEKITILKYLEENMDQVATKEAPPSNLEKPFETLANSVYGNKKNVPEDHPSPAEDIINNPAMSTIKDMVSEMTSEDLVEIDKFMFGTEPQFVKKEAEEPVGKSLNDKLHTKISVGLNDKLAFVKHLFHNDSAAFNKTIDQLNTIEHMEKAVQFIQHMVKPEFNQWEGKEEYEERFMLLIERRFA
ncbi:MAG: hypothetical protein OIF50_07865 [Flavobacteriaceae bacterium]|nr:hypothetical protein [Flavobacteriaceae bacterium]